MTNYPNITIGKNNKKDELNLRTNNLIVIKGNKSTGKSYIAVDLINKAINVNSDTIVTIISWQDKILYNQKESYEFNQLDLLEDLLREIENDEDLYEGLEHKIFYIDGLHIGNDKEKEILDKIVNKIKFTRYTLIVTTRDELKLFPEILIETNFNDDYHKLKVTHNSKLYHSPVSKMVLKEDFNVEKHFYLLNKKFNITKL